MKHVLLFGAGKSATVLIDYLIQQAAIENWQLTVVDANLALAESKTAGSPQAKAVSFDITHDTERQQYIAQASLVISMLPPSLHFLVAKDCLTFSKHLLTASYVDDSIRALQEQIEKKDILFLCEMGLDPGIDHMSAMKMIDEIKNAGGTITSFKSHCGGLVAPSSDDNPWHYKISWNPRNIVLAGVAGAVYRQEKKKVSLPYHKIFETCPLLDIPALPGLAWYPNRDSFGYMPVYGLEQTDTFIRTTLRYDSFCRGWNVVCHLGLTDTTDGDVIKNYTLVNEWFRNKLNALELKEMTWLEYLKIYVDEKDHAAITEQMDYLCLFEELAIPTAATCSADILQFLLEKTWVLKPQDKDMIVMLHEIEYSLHQQLFAVRSLLIVEGEDGLRTAMAKTVGLPLAIAAKHILNGTITTRGLQIPILPEIYQPVLNELANYQIRFKEELQVNLP